MKMSATNRHNGFSLLELMLVLVLIAVILIVGIGRYQLYRREKDIAALQQNIDMLFLALNTDYRINCRASSTYKPNISNLKFNFIDTRLAPSIANYAVNASQIGTTTASNKPIYQLSVSVTLPPNTPIDTMSFYQQKLNATTFSGTTLTWTRLPSYSIPGVSGGLWISTSGLRTFKEVIAGTVTGKKDDSCAY